MRISRIQIGYFRNFANLDVRLSENAVIVGENKIGKSNLLYALRLVLDPSLPDSARKLREEDFWDGLARPFGATDKITISVELADFEDDENKLAVLAEHLIEPEPMVAKLTYVWQPVPGLQDGPKKNSDYEFVIYGGDRPENRINYQVRQRLPMELIPALRDCESDLARWTRSPLKPLLDKAAREIESTDQDALQEIAGEIDETTEKLTEIKEINSVAKSISEKLIDMVGSAQALETMLRFSPTDANRLIRALRIYIDGGVRSISDASLGSANLLYFALKALEYDQMVAEGDRDHTFLAIEEPESHLHPNLQRLIFRNYLKQRGSGSDGASRHSLTVLMTTHSPHIASVTPLKDFVVLRHPTKDANFTEAVSTAEIDLEDDDIADLERYIDVNRGEVLFAKGVILVEGDSERYLLPILARRQGFDLDELGISVCSIAGTNFAPYLRLFGTAGLNIPVVVLTDLDPRSPKKDGTERTPLGPKRVATSLIKAKILSKDEITPENYKLGENHGVFVSSYATLEVDLYASSLHTEISAAMLSLTESPKMKSRIEKWWADEENQLEVKSFLKDIESIGKGRFAQRLAGAIAKTGTTACPDYIKKGLKYVTERCK